MYVNVNMFSGQLMNTWIDSLQAFFPGLQVLGPRGKGSCALSPHGPVRPGPFAPGRLMAQYARVGLCVALAPRTWSSHSYQALGLKRNRVSSLDDLSLGRLFLF